VSMKTRTVLFGVLLAGVVAALIMGAGGMYLQLGMPPWSWASTSSDWVGNAIEWSRAMAMLLPEGVVIGLIVAFICALVFEYVTRRSGWLVGALVGLIVGAMMASIVGLLPWLGFWYSYAYMPPLAPLGPYDPTWFFLVVVSTGLVAGAIAGALYGLPVHAT